MLKNSSKNSTAGLPPDWCKKDGTPEQTVYKYDAARVPWRIGWAYSWYGHADAKDICSKIATWISTKTGNDASKVVDGYNLDGSELGEYNNATFTGPFACAGLVDAAHQTWLDNAYTHLNKLVDSKDVYYQQSLKLITLLLLSGNMPDFWSTTGIEPESNYSKSAVNSSTLSFTSSASPEIFFATANAGHVKISLYTISGKLVATPVDGVYSAGNNRMSLNQVLNAGTYIVRLCTSNGELTQQTTVTR